MYFCGMKALEYESIRTIQTFISLRERNDHRKYLRTVEPGIEGIYDFEWTISLDRFWRPLLLFNRVTMAEHLDTFTTGTISHSSIQYADNIRIKYLAPQICKTCNVQLFKNIFPFPNLNISQKYYRLEFSIRTEKLTYKIVKQNYLLMKFYLQLCIASSLLEFIISLTNILLTLYTFEHEFSYVFIANVYRFWKYTRVCVKLYLSRSQYLIRTEIVDWNVSRSIPCLEFKNHSSWNNMMQRICKYHMRWNVGGIYRGWNLSPAFHWIVSNKKFCNFSFVFHSNASWLYWISCLRYVFLEKYHRYIS